MQLTFSPLDYGFAWEGDWYTFDSAAAHTAARKDRDAAAKEYKRLGYRIVKFSLRDQLVSRGGIGTGHPHIELHVNCYGFNAYYESED